MVEIPHLGGDRGLGDVPPRAHSVLRAGPKIIIIIGIKGFIPKNIINVKIFSKIWSFGKDLITLPSSNDEKSAPSATKVNTKFNPIKKTRK